MNPNASESFYDILGIARDASNREIRRAFLRLAQQHHPDLNNDCRQADRDFKRIRRIYEVLNDPLRRAAYDDNPSRFSLEDVGTSWHHDGPIVTQPRTERRKTAPKSKTRFGHDRDEDRFRPQWQSDKRSEREKLFFVVSTSFAILVVLSVLSFALLTRPGATVSPSAMTSQSATIVTSPRPNEQTETILDETLTTADVDAEAAGPTERSDTPAPAMGAILSAVQLQEELAEANINRIPIQPVDVSQFGLPDVDYSVAPVHVQMPPFDAAPIPSISSSPVRVSVPTTGSTSQFGDVTMNPFASSEDSEITSMFKSDTRRSLGPLSFTNSFVADGFTVTNIMEGVRRMLPTNPVTGSKPSLMTNSTNDVQLGHDLGLPVNDSDALARMGMESRLPSARGIGSPLVPPSNILPPLPQRPAYPGYSETGALPGNPWGNLGAVPTSGYQY